MAKVDFGTAANPMVFGTAAAAGGGAVAGASALPMLDPTGGIATGLIGYNILGGGKSKEQKARDSVRESYKNMGLINDDWTVNLADGSTFDVGMDGSSGMRDWKDPSKRTSNQQDINKLHAYDVDYTSDLDFFAGLGGTSMSRLLSGKKDDSVDKIGRQLGNASIGNIGFGADFTQENFSKMTANQRAMYAKAGIKSKEEAFALANQAFADGRIEEEDLLTMQQSFNMVYDDDFSLAQKLNSGRWNGVEGATKMPKPYGQQSMVPQGAMDLIWHGVPNERRPEGSRTPGGENVQGPLSGSNNDGKPGTGSIIGGVLGAGAGLYFGAGSPAAGALGAGLGGAVGGMFD